MTNRLPRDWRLHGHHAKTALLADVLPRQGTHYLTGREDIPLIADLAVSIASDSATCGLSAPDKSGARASLSGFFGHATGAAEGVVTGIVRRRPHRSLGYPRAKGMLIRE